MQTFCPPYAKSCKRRAETSLEQSLIECERMQVPIPRHTVPGECRDQANLRDKSGGIGRRAGEGGERKDTAGSFHTVSRCPSELLAIPRCAISPLASASESNSISVGCCQGVRRVETVESVDAARLMSRRGVECGPPKKAQSPRVAA